MRITPRLILQVVFMSTFFYQSLKATIVGIYLSDFKSPTIENTQQVVGDFKVKGSGKGGDYLSNGGRNVYSCALLGGAMKPCGFDKNTNLRNVTIYWFYPENTYVFGRQRLVYGVKSNEEWLISPIETANMYEKESVSSSMPFVHAVLFGFLFVCGLLLIVNHRQTQGRVD